MEPEATKKELANHHDEEKCISIGETVREDVEEGNQATYPHLLESSPFPILANLDQVARTLTEQSRASVKKARGDDGTDAQSENAKPSLYAPYPTEGLRNPGWLVVVSNFLVNFFVFGVTFSWGNFQRLYLQDVYAGQTDQFRIAFVGTSASACLLSMGLFVTPVIRRFGYRWTMCIGAIFAPLSLILASFATQLWHIYLSQGILFGISAAFAFSPSVALPAQWFVRNRALATGIAVSGSGIGGVAISPMSQQLISSIGYRNALRAIGGMGFGILFISTALAQSRWRPPPAEGRGIRSIIDTSVVTGHFWILLLFALIVPFGYVGPFFLAPTFASYIGADAASGANLVSIMSAMNAVCRISMGFFADRFGRLNTMFACTLAGGIFTMCLWQFSTSYGIFVAYAILYGLNAGAFVSLFPVVTADIVGLEKVQGGLSICYMATMLGNLLGTPIAGALESKYGWTAAIQFSGAPSVLAALVLLVLRFLRSRGKIFVKI